MTEGLVERQEEIWRIADVIRNASVHTPNGPRSVGYYIGVGLDSFNHPEDRYQALLNAAAEAVIAALTPYEEGRQ